MDRAAFLAERRNGIGGSDVAAILGISPFRSAYDLWLEKTGQIEAKPAGPAAAIGTLLEPLVLSEIVKRFGLLGEDEAAMILHGGSGTNHVFGSVEIAPAQMRHSKFDYMLAHVDGIVWGDSPIILEAKTGGPHRKAEWDEDGVPPYYISQIEHYMEVVGCERTYIGVYFLGQWPPRFVEYFSNPELREIIVEEEAKFWECVQEMRPPCVDGSVSTRQALREISRVDKGKVIQLPDEYLSKVRRYHELRAEGDALQLQAQEIANEIESVMGDACKAFVGDIQVASRSETTRRSLDRKRLETDHPELRPVLAEYEQESSFQRFTIAKVDIEKSVVNNSEISRGVRR
jgi:predicted phage-related endonuclease